MFVAHTLGSLFHPCVSTIVIRSGDGAWPPSIATNWIPSKILSALPKGPTGGCVKAAGGCWVVCTTEGTAGSALNQKFCCAVLGDSGITRAELAYFGADARSA